MQTLLKEITAQEQKNNWEAVIEVMKKTEKGRHNLTFAYLGLARAEEQLAKQD